MLKNEKSANRNDHQNRKTDLKNSQNRKTENPNAPLIIDCVTTNLNDGGQGGTQQIYTGRLCPEVQPLTL